MEASNNVIMSTLMDIHGYILDYKWKEGKKINVLRMVSHLGEEKNLPV